MRLAGYGLMVLMMGMATARAQTDSSQSIEFTFDLDSYTLSANEKSRVDSLLQAVPVTILKKIEIYGHTDSLAGIEYNRILSKRRVQSVLQYLVYRGIDPRQVQTDYYGEERPKYDNGPAERPKNRRVELVLVIDPSLIPPPEQKLTDLPFNTGDKIRIPNLNFVGNQPIPVGESFAALEELLEVMRTYPDLEIELHGHVCCGDDYELSLQRALMVYNFLRSNGIDRKRLGYKGFSNTQPLFPERTDRDKALNRRVEALVVKNTNRRESTEPSVTTIDVEARFLNLKFFPQKARLYPSGDFFLGLVTEMMKESEGLFYEFIVFDNINDQRLTRQRADRLKRAINAKRVDAKIYSVRSLSKPRGMPESENENYITVKIRQG